MYCLDDCLTYDILVADERQALRIKAASHAREWTNEHLTVTATVGQKWNLLWFNNHIKSSVEAIVILPQE
jgi:hypothetical protein